MVQLTFSDYSISSLKLLLDLEPGSAGLSAQLRLFDEHERLIDRRDAVTSFQKIDAIAGSTVVHSIGGWVALALLIHIGPRIGRFDKQNRPVKINGSNLPLAMVGGIILWVGWIGFNGGSALALNASVTGIIGNTLIGASGGLLAALFTFKLIRGYFEALAPLNGSLAGLVAVTACAHSITAGEALLTGIAGGLVVFPTESLLHRFKIDDAIGAIPVHLAAGIVGTLAVAFFGNPEILGTGLSFTEQLLAQITGIAATGIFAFGLTWLLFYFINRVMPLRVLPEDEMAGLNVSEHRASTELLDLFTAMDHQKKTGDLSSDVPVEPFTEVGQIAERYNSVLGKVRETLTENEKAREDLNKAYDRVQKEQKRAEKLLLNILPAPIAEQLKNERGVIAHQFPEVTILFADIVGFTRMASEVAPEQVVEILNKIFSYFDLLAEKYNLEKIKTIGDSYMLVGGLPEPDTSHAEKVILAALDMKELASKFRIRRKGKPLQIRIGINSGPVVAGVIGQKKFIYDIWGDAVNSASRLESHGVANEIQISEKTADLVKKCFHLEDRGAIELKGKGSFRAFLVRGIKSLPEHLKHFEQFAV